MDVTCHAHTHASIKLKAVLGGIDCAQQCWQHYWRNASRELAVTASDCVLHEWRILESFHATGNCKQQMAIYEGRKERKGCISQSVHSILVMVDGLISRRGSRILKSGAIKVAR